jgi:opacity protein-like surface antigen
MKRFGYLTLFMLLSGHSLLAQNSDLGFLFGFSQRNASVRNDVIRGEVSVSFQVNYARQLVEGKGGRLYLEFPALFAGGSNGEISNQVIGRAGGTAFFTPGLRYHYNLASRVAIYAAAGAGIAHKEERFGTVVGNQVIERDESNTGGAYNFGGGLDFRLTRLWSLRGEVRSFRTTQAATLTRRSTIAQIGFALHF